ncbi:uncharacterized protein LOC104899030 [Beta vulgaris subsp. vulgaris]|uniref:uncharacterized protein LOC104899030 n=1 Tax=Beta vulgaris subsp. vulgaris TaxID=3555 RepID=UPI00053F822A|nr:uncharacterized protein LOC104899030 [Beta vulgaris subsp. vulgaris]
MGKLTHPLQGAFVLDRLIQDNILLAREVFHSFRKKGGTSGWLAIKLDIEKAYDRLEWSFIFEMLAQLGFDARWIGWIRECIKTASFSVLVYGITGASFSSSRGIRQGDTLSLYLLILCAELLARNLSLAGNQRDKLNGVSVGHSGVRIPFLTFSYDTMIFAKASESSCRLIRAILNKYFSHSGQLVNYHKSSFQVTSNISNYMKANFANVLVMVESQDLGEYLRYPIITSRVTKETFGKVASKVTNQLPKWKANSRSQAGRLVLIQSNLTTKDNYQMQSFYLPKSILTSLDKTYRIFFWNKDASNASTNLIGWDRICKPKCFGGLGLRKADTNNIAMQFKLLWKFLTNNNNLWVKLVR